MLVAIGLNQRGATVADREVLALAPTDIRAALAGYAALGGIEEVAVVSTCHRVEIYAATCCPTAAVLELRRARHGAGGPRAPAVRAPGRGGVPAPRARRVEPRVRDPRRAADPRAGEGRVPARRWTRASPATSSPPCSARALQIAKRVRTETAIGRSGVSWGHAAAALAEKVLGPLAGRRVAVLGAGEMARVSAQHLRAQGASIVVLNRTLANARGARARGGRRGGAARGAPGRARARGRGGLGRPAAPAAFRPEELARTARRPPAPARPRGPGGAARNPARDRRGAGRLPVRRGRPRPRHARGDGGRARRRSRTRSGSSARRWRAGRAPRRSAGRRPLIQELRSRAATIAREEVERTLRRVGGDPELARRLDAMAGSIVAKLLHQPSACLRKAVGEAGEAAPLVAAAVEIFGLGTPATAGRGREA